MSAKLVRVRFTADYDYHPDRHTTVAYKAEMEEDVEQLCADDAIAGGHAVLVDAKAAKADKTPA